MNRLLRILSLYVVIPLIVVAALGYNIMLRTSEVDQPRYDDSSIQVPLRAIVLVRSGQLYGAFKILRTASRGAFMNGAKYEYWFQPDGSRDFMKPNVEHGTGYVYERYNRRDRMPNGYVAEEDAGSQLNIKCGPLWVEWSSGHYIYPHPYLHPRFEPMALTTDIQIAATTESNLAQVSASDPSLRWIARDDGANRK